MNSSDAMSAVVISDALAKKLEAVNDEIVLLFGWADDSQIVCLGCVAIDQIKLDDPSSHSADVYINSLISLLPAGFGFVGVYKSTPIEEREGLRSTLDRILCSKLKYFLVHSALVYLNNRLNGDDALRRNDVCLYDPVSSEFFSASTLSIVDVESLMSGARRIRVCGKLPLTFETNNDVELFVCNIERSFDALKNKILSPICAFRLQNSDIVLFDKSNSLNGRSPFTNDSRCAELDAYLAKDENQTKKPNQKKKNNKKGANTDSSNFHNMDILLQITGSDAIRQTITCVPIIRYERRDFSSIQMIITVDVIAVVPSTMSIATLPALLADGVVTQLSAMKQCVCKFYESNNELQLTTVYHFMLPDLLHTVSPIYPDGLQETELEQYRKELHQKLMLPFDRPLLRRAMKYIFPNEVSDGPYLQNVHIGLPQSTFKNGQQALVRGSYTYHHYMQDRADDNCWGCAYRSLQTLVSWYRCQGYTDKPIPTHTEIQQALVDIGDKPSSFVNSRNWIGSMEVSYCLEHLIGVSSKIIFVSSGSELASKGRELVKHFQTQGTPIMIGGGVLAHTILGVDFDDQCGDVKFLILDPHYTGSEDLHTIQTKGWCGWKGTNFWDKTAYYNLCCPQRPSGI